MTLSFKMGYDDPLYLLVDLFDMHKRAPDCFAAARRELFTELFNTQAPPAKLYAVMVCFIAAKAATMVETAELYSKYMSKLDTTPIEETPVDEDQSTAAFRRFLEENPSSSEAKDYDV